MRKQLGFFLNPFYWFSLIWALILLAYQFRWSELYEPLDDRLLLFFLVTILSSAAVGAVYQKFVLSRKKIVYQRAKYFRLLMILLPVGYALEFLYAGHIPLIDELLNTQYTYMDFRGIPTFHVLLITFSLFYAAYLFRLFLAEYDQREKRKFLLGFLFVFALMTTQYNRGLLLMAAFTCAMVLAFHLKKLTLRYILLFLLFAVLLLYGFGVFGNIRSGSAWNDTSYIIGIAKIDLNAYPSFLPQEFIWAYVYLISPLGNLNHYVIHYLPETNLSAFLCCLLPDALSKRIFGEYDMSIPLVAENLTVSSGFASAYRYGGFVGAYLQFIVLCLFTLGVGLLSRVRSSSFIVTHALLSCVMAFTFFDNMLTYTGLTFSLVWSILLIFDFRRSQKRVAPVPIKLQPQKE